MTLPCETVRDLIPLVQDTVASAQSKALVDAHLAGCDDCRRFYDATGRELPIPPAHLNKYDEPAESEQVKRLGKKIKKRRIAMVVVVAVLLFVALLPSIVILSISGLIVTTGDSYSTTDISQYGMYEGHIHNEALELRMHTSLPLFPKEITGRHQVDAFYYYCSTQSLDNLYQAYLSYTLPPEDFRAEVERFAKMGITTGDVPAGSQQYGDIRFEYPAYVLRCDVEHSTYEYALVDEANYRIVCVYSYIKDIRTIPMERSYLPKRAFHWLPSWHAIGPIAPAAFFRHKLPAGFAIIEQMNPAQGTRCIATHAPASAPGPE